MRHAQPNRVFSLDIAASVSFSGDNGRQTGMVALDQLGVRTW